MDHAILNLVISPPPPHPTQPNHSRGTMESAGKMRNRHKNELRVSGWGVVRGWRRGREQGGGSIGAQALERDLKPLAKKLSKDEFRAESQRQREEMERRHAAELAAVEGAEAADGEAPAEAAAGVGGGGGEGEAGGGAVEEEEEW